ncbi:TonB-dependent receptor domain-containing protein [Luteimonas sp. A277]
MNRISNRNRLVRRHLPLAISALLAPCAALAGDPAADTLPSATQLDAVQVRGEYIPEPMLMTSEVASFVTREDFERTGDSDAAAALARVTGLSLVRGKFVYVRGLGERYSSALFNGSPLPSPEPLQRVVPLDLFPSEVLESVTVQKTYSARYPGEFGGGVIDLQSLAVPEQPFFNLSIGTGGNSVTTFEKGLTHFGSDDDFWGYDDGTRKVPRELADAMATGRRVDLGEFGREDIRRIGRSLQNANIRVLQEKDSIDPDLSFGGSAGWSMDMGNDARLGFIAVGGFDNEWRTRFGVQQDPVFIDDVVQYNSSYDFLSTTNNAKVNVLLGAGWESPRHRVALTSLYVHDTLKETRSRAGHDNLAGFDARDDYTEWFERELINNQVSGSHSFGEFDDLKIEWRGAVARATRDAPYETGIRYENIDGYWSHDGSRVQNYLRFSNVKDEVASGGVDVTWRLPVERDITLTGGFAYSDNDRNAENREFRFLALDGPLPHYNRFQRPDYLFSDYNLSNDLLRLREVTGNSGDAAYDATLKVKAGYLQTEAEINPFVRATVGVRYEDATQAVHTYNIFTGERQGGVEPLRNSYVLPAATVTWNFSDNQQIRFGASKTIARPQFRELSPLQYLDPDIDRTFYGNPYLVDSELVNLDARYEWFFGSGEYVTLGAFYKDIDRPIESNVNDAPGGGILQSFLNAPSATLFGFEAEVKKYVDLPIQANWWGDKRLYLAANYTWSDSEVEVKDGDTVHPYGFSTSQDATLFVRDGSQLQGQSSHIGNLQLGIESETSGTQATLIANYVGERVSARGRPGQPDYMENPGTSLDLVLRQKFNLGGHAMSLGLSARNILEADFREYQQAGGNKVDVYRYEPGVSYTLSLSASF